MAGRCGYDCCWDTSTKAIRPLDPTTWTSMPTKARSRSVPASVPSVVHSSPTDSASSLRTTANTAREPTEVKSERDAGGTWVSTIPGLTSLTSEGCAPPGRAHPKIIRETATRPARATISNLPEDGLCFAGDARIVRCSASEGKCAFGWGRVVRGGGFSPGRTIFIGWGYRPGRAGIRQPGVSTPGGRRVGSRSGLARRSDGSVRSDGSDRFRRGTRATGAGVLPERMGLPPPPADRPPPPANEPPPPAVEPPPAAGGPPG